MHYARLGQAEYLKQANRDVFVTVQVETVELLAELDEALTLEGLDSLVLGPQDLSGSMGRLGETTHPDVIDAMKTIASKANFPSPCGPIRDQIETLAAASKHQDASLVRTRLRPPDIFACRQRCEDHHKRDAALHVIEPRQMGRRIEERSVNSRF
jgi:2-keto-3-deoxy-L-rhamnonate aldolase RhmA